MNAKNFKVAVDLYVKKPKFRNLYCDFESFKLLVTNEFYFVDGESIFIFKKEIIYIKNFLKNLTILVLMIK